MTALTANFDAERKDGVLVCYKVAAATKIYKGAMVAVNADGYAVPAADAAGLKFVGYAYEPADNSAGAAGDAVLRVWKDGSFLAAKSDAGQSDIGNDVYIVDDNTVAASTTYGVLAGTVVEVPAPGFVRVLIKNAVK